MRHSTFQQIGLQKQKGRETNGDRQIDKLRARERQRESKLFRSCKPLNKHYMLRTQYKHYICRNRFTILRIKSIFIDLSKPFRPSLPLLCGFQHGYGLIRIDRFNSIKTIENHNITNTILLIWFELVELNRIETIKFERALKAEQF